MKLYYILITIITVNQFVYSQSVFEDNYSFNVTQIFNGKINFGGHKAKFGKTKKESETLYEMEIKIDIKGLEENKLIDFNLFSLVDHQHNFRYRIHYVSFDTTFGGGFSIKRIKAIDFPFIKDSFLNYSLPDYNNYDKYKLEANSLSMITNKSKSYKYILAPVTPNKMLLRIKRVKLYFYTKIKKEGAFSLYYKDKVIKIFTTTKKNRLKFK